MNDLEWRFHREMVNIYETAKRDLGYNATRFLQMLVERGSVATARHLVTSPALSEGFTVLWEHHRLDLTVEAHVLKDEYTGLFTEEEREKARDRLQEYGWLGSQ